MQDEIQKLIDHCVDYATELLTETGESYPFGAYIDTIGNVHPLEMEIDTKNIPKLGKVIDTLKTYCMAEIEAKRMNGFALSYEVSMDLDEKSKTDAIAIELHHSNENKLPVYYLPFRMNDDKSVVIGTIFAVK